MSFPDLLWLLGSACLGFLAVKFHGIFMILAVSVLALCMLMSFRNIFVHKERMRILQEDSKEIRRQIESGGDFNGHPRYDKLPSYSRMLWQLWKWRYP